MAKKEEVKKVDISGIISNIEKRFGKEAISGNESNVERVSSGSIALDAALGGGYPKGRLVEIVGWQSVGKTTLALHLAANIQKQNKVVAYVDMEHCMTGEMNVYIPSEGRNVTCKELYEKNEEFDVLSYVNKSFIPQKAIIKKTGTKKVFKINTMYGSSIELTGNHEVLTDEGYVKVENLSVGDYLFKPLNIPNNFPESEEDNDLYFLLGFYMGDGDKITGKDTPVIAKTDKELLSEIDRIVQKYNCKLVTCNNKINHRITSKDQSVYKFEGLVELFNSGMTIKELSQKYGVSLFTIKTHLIQNGIDKSYDFRRHASSLRNKKRDLVILEEVESRKKFVNNISEFFSKFPECFVGHKQTRMPKNLNFDQLRHFLAGYIMADGTVVDINFQHRASLSVSTSSKSMMKDLQSALMCFGINSHITVYRKKGYDDNYNIAINSVSNFKKVQKYFPLLSYKGDRLERAIANVSELDRNKYKDNTLKCKIKSIESIGVREVYDISVNSDVYDNQNFLCENLIIHNCVDLEYTRSLGVDTENGLWYLSQPNCGEDGIEIAREFAKSPDVGLVVIDSVNALVPKAVIQGEAGDAKMALLARMMSQMIPTLLSVANKSGCIILFISQWREKMVMFGSPLTTTGGNALKFYASQRLDMATAGQEKDGEEVVANKVKVKIIKNKVSSPFKIANFQIRFGVGIDKLQEIVDLGVETEVIRKAGSWYSYGDVKLGQGAESVKSILRDNPELYEELEEKILKIVKLSM